MVLDISVIVALQVAALVYGLTTVYSQTPSFLVLTYEGLYLVSRHEKETYLEESSFLISDQVAADPIRYAGKIPVYLMSEPQAPEQRSIQNNGFMFSESMPYYLNTSVYKPFENFNHLIVDGSATSLTVRGTDCTELSFISVHGLAMACLEIEGKVLRKIN